METSQIPCSHYCMRCQNIGVFFVNHSKYHKMCTDCSNFRYSGVLECFHCNSIVFSLPECYVQCEVNNISLKNHPEGIITDESIQINEEIIVAKDTQESKIEINKANLITCECCRFQFEDPFIIAYRNFNYCLGCFKAIKDAQGEPEKILCTACKVNECTELKCGHIICKDCIKPQKCVNCYNYLDFECCSEVCGQVLSGKYPGCNHPKCIKCPNNFYCLNKGCIKKNFEIGQVTKNCIIDQKDVCQYLILICGHIVCKDCFNFDLTSTSFNCFYCVRNFKDINCLYCKKPMEWENLVENCAFKNCCKKAFCLICYSEVNEKLEHKCKINSKSIWSFFWT